MKSYKAAMSLFVCVKAVLGPHLYRIYHTGNIPGQLYVANTAESFGDSVIRWVNIMLLVLDMVVDVL